MSGNEGKSKKKTVWKILGGTIMVVGIAIFLPRVLEYVYNRIEEKRGKKRIKINYDDLRPIIIKNSTGEVVNHNG